MPPQISLQPGSTNTAAVKQLQDWLVANGYMTQAQVATGYGTYGPQTTRAVQAAQQKLGVDNSSGPGYWGPKTIAAVSAGPGNAPAAQIFTTPNGTKVDAQGNIVTEQPKTQAELDALYTSAAVAHPALAGNSPEAIAYASSTGDFSALINNQGQPFSAADQAEAQARGEADLAPFYKAEQLKDTQDVELALGQKQIGYEKFLGDEAQNFETEKAAQDQTAADRGVLFSGGRAQKLQNLGDTYRKNQEFQRSAYGADIANTARDFGYKYGDTAAAGLSKYYSLGGNTYNPNVANGGVTRSSLSSVYGGGQGFQGTQINAAKAAAQQRAAGYLANKGNKLLSTGYTNKF